MPESSGDTKILPPVAGRRTNVVFGCTASGNTVADSPSIEFFREVLRTWSKVPGVERKGFGPANAAESVKDKGKAVSYR